MFRSRMIKNNYIASMLVNISVQLGNRLQVQVPMQISI